MDWYYKGIKPKADLFEYVGGPPSVDTNSCSANQIARANRSIWGDLNCNLVARPLSESHTKNVLEIYNL